MGNTTFCLSVYLLMGIWVASASWSMWVMLQIPPFDTLVGHLCSGRSVFFKSYDHFWFFILTVNLWVLYVFWVLFLIRCMICKYFIPFHVMPFYSVDSFFGCAEVLKTVCPICLFLLLLPVLLVSCLWNRCQDRCHEVFLFCFLPGVFPFQVSCLGL